MGVETRLLATVANAVALYESEANRIHELLDTAGVPRTTNDQPLSISQRVEESLRMARIARQKD